jgi:hypothetical protein
MQAEAERLLEEALKQTGARDPREPCRALLRDLKDRSPSDYEQAVTEYRERVVRGIASEGADPLVRWIEFGCATVQRLNPGRTIVVDETGKAAPFAPPPSWRQLILHLPDDRKSRALLVSSPAVTTAAQSATIELLVQGRFRLPQDDREEE